MKRHAHNFKEMQRVAERYYNDKGFCGVVALAAAAQVALGKARSTLMNGKLDISDMQSAWEDSTDNGIMFYSEKHRQMIPIPFVSQRQHRKGTCIATSFAAGHKLGLSFTRFNAPAKTLGKCAQSLPSQGVYWIWTTKHITCVEDGQIIDWSNESRRHHVLAVFKVQRNFTPIERKAA